MNRVTQSPKASVCIVTYNQAKFIEQCVRSALEQITDFEFNVIVGDDHSGDGTTEILKRLKDEFPDKLRLILHEKNINGTNNYFSVHNAATGQYVAHIDGDDYWLPGKLQKMVEAMDANPDVNIAWHRVYIEVEDGARVVAMPIGDHKRLFGGHKLSFATLIKYYGTTGQHSASIYRRSARKIFAPPPGARVLDYFHTLMLCEDGFGLYVDDVLSVYRTFRSEQTITNTRGAPAVVNGLLHLFEHYLKKRPEFKKEICAQALFQAVQRGAFGSKQWPEFIKIAMKTKALPKISDLYFIARIFMSERNGVKVRLLQQYRKQN